MLLGIGTSQAWSIFAGFLRAEHGLSALQAQFVFTTTILSFCLSLLVAGRLHDRFGPRPVALAGSAIIGLGYFITCSRGHSFPFLWLGMGVLAGVGNATVYTCPIATAITCFPRQRGLMAGLAAAAFGAGPVLVQHITVPLLQAGWPALKTIGRLGTLYVPVLLAMSLLLPAHDAAPEHRARVAGFRSRALLRDVRFWTLFVGMLCGTFPYLVTTGSARSLAAAWCIRPAAVAWVIPALALGNAAGRILFGATLDRAGTRRAMWTAQALAVAATLALPWTRGSAGGFLACLAVIGLCYGSNFAIYPGTIARVYGVELLGSVYPWVMIAQGISSFGPTGAGLLSDLTGSYRPGLLLAAGVAAAGLVAGVALGLRQPGREESWMQPLR